MRALGARHDDAGLDDSVLRPAESRHIYNSSLVFMRVRILALPQDVLVLPAGVICVRRPSKSL